MVFSAKTDTGYMRAHNEDCLGSYVSKDGKTTFLIVADGMGGMNAGEVASKIQVELFLKKVSELDCSGWDDDRLAAVAENAIKEANAVIYQEALKDPDRYGMGTTAVICIVHEDKLITANVGDSRAYISTKSELIRVSRDHSYVEDLVQQGAISSIQARKHPDRNIITRAVGCMEHIEVDIFVNDFGKDSVLLMCSDGLNNMVEDDYLQRIIRRNKNMDKLADRLISVAKKNGGADNITVIVARRSNEVNHE